MLNVHTCMLKRNASDWTHTQKHEWHSKWNPNQIFYVLMCKKSENEKKEKLFQSNNHLDTFSSSNCFNFVSVMRSPRKSFFDSSKVFSMSKSVESFYFLDLNYASKWLIKISDRKCCWCRKTWSSRWDFNANAWLVSTNQATSWLFKWSSVLITARDFSLSVPWVLFIGWIYQSSRITHISRCYCAPTCERVYIIKQPFLLAYIKFFNLTWLSSIREIHTLHLRLKYLCSALFQRRHKKPPMQSARWFHHDRWNRLYHHLLGIDAHTLQSQILHWWLFKFRICSVDRLMALIWMAGF